MWWAGWVGLRVGSWDAIEPSRLLITVITDCVVKDQAEDVGEGNVQSTSFVLPNEWENGPAEGKRLCPGLQCTTPRALAQAHCT